MTYPFKITLSLLKLTMKSFYSHDTYLHYTEILYLLSYLKNVEREMIRNKVLKFKPLIVIDFWW